MRRFWNPGRTIRFPARNARYIAALLLASASAVSAQVVGKITTDGTLGVRQTFTGPTYQIPASAGRQVGNNLFHSFSDFSIGTGETASFSGPDSIVNVIVRVTGGPSQIDGTIQSTMPAANFYLINSAGVVFGPNAALDVKGSFTVTTADYVKLGSSGIFHANSDISVLSTESPSAFGFLGNSPASISINGSQIRGPQGSGISIIGGQIQIQNSQISASAGPITLVSVASPGEVTIDPAHREQAPNVDAFTQMGDIHVTNSTLRTDDRTVTDFDNPAQKPGNFFIRTGTLSADNSNLFAGSFGIVDGGILDIVTTGDAQFIDDSNISVEPTGGNGGHLMLAARDVVVADSYVSASSFGPGDAGEVDIHARNLTQSGDLSGITASAFFEDASAGVVNIQASDTVSLESRANASLFVFSGIQADAGNQSTGNGGMISIATKNLMMDGGGISAVPPVTSGPGDHGGAINIAAESILMKNGSVITASTDVSSSSGAVTILPGTKLLSMKDQSTISASTGGTGLGAVTIDADAIFLAGGSSIDAELVGGGSGGSILVTTSQLHLGGASSISTQVNFIASGDAGNVVIDSLGPVTLLGGSLIQASNAGGGNAGSVSISTSQLVVGGNSLISVAATNEIFAGAGGDITIVSRSNILLSRSKIRADVGALDESDSGNITLTAPGVVNLFDSQITAQAGAHGGRITIDPTAVILNDSIINGIGGVSDVFVTIDADELLVSPNSKILTNTGSFTIDTQFASGLTRLLSSLLLPIQLQESCFARYAGFSISTFSVATRGGLSILPAGSLPALDLAEAASSTQPAPASATAPEGK